MKYLIIGGGAMGSVIAAYMTKAGKDVTLITRGKHLDAIHAQGGLRLQYAPAGQTYDIPVNAVSEEDYDEKPDVVIVAVKAYSLDTIFPLLDRVARPDTVILPLLNALDMGSQIARGMTQEAIVAQGVAYVACELVQPGECKHKEDFFRIVFGPRPGGSAIPAAETIRSDLSDMGATAEISDDMLQAALLKLARVSTASGAMVHYNATIGEILEDPEMLEFMVSLCREVVAIADAAGCPFPAEFDAVEHLLNTARAINPNYKTSLMYDYLAGTTTEAETVFHEPYLLGRRLGLEMKAYAQVCQKFGYAVD